MPDKLHYHLIGIGGIGMSWIAHILHDRGEVVTGSDRQENDVVRRLRSAGIRVSIGHDAENVREADVVVYTAAVTADNPEMVEARRRGIALLERPAMLDRLMEPYRHRVAVSGTHGKTTTTSMISSILEAAGLDATALIGADVRSLGGNVRLGRSSIVVTEACEAFESFLHLHPSMAVITNIDADHLDYYGTIERIEESFRRFLSQVDPDGSVVACWDDPRVRRVVEDCGRNLITFGVQGSPDFLAAELDVSSPEPCYTLIRRGEALGRISLGVPGKQNVVDSLAAVAVAFELGAGFEAAQRALREFRGAGRRFEVLFDRGDVMVVDDYAHHPAEIAATLSGARSAYGGRRITAVFQPHLFSRTKAFLAEFSEALSAADEVIVTSIYAAREQPMDGVSGEGIVNMMKGNGFAAVRYAPEKSTVAGELAARVGPGDLVLVFGAGDIRAVGEELAAILSGRTDLR